VTLTPETLAEAMEHRLPIQGYQKLFPAMNQAMIAAECTTVERAAGWIAQLGCESGGLRWFTELGDNCQRYEGRDDLGNDQPGDGCRYKGRGPIQVTGRAHYANLSRWAHERGLAPTPTYFVDRPDELAAEHYGFIGAVWYWLTHTRRGDQDGVVKHLNDYCDERDIVGMTKAVNGGTHGLDVRTRLWDQALAMGDAILPSGDVVPPPKPNISPRPDWQGDPTFLPEVLRAWGVEPVEFDGWKTRGHGDFGSIWGIIHHHTGNINETNEGIAHHPALGLAANMLIHPDGQVVLTGAGVAWHAGEGIYPGIREDAANQVTIGIECAYGPDRDGRFTIPWPDVQVQTMVTVAAAITWFLGIPVEHNIAHKEWAGADNPLGINKQGKPDPANFDMNVFRGQIAQRLAEGPSNGETDDMIPPDEWRAVFEVITRKRPSKSMYRSPGEGTVGDIADFITNEDAMAHQELIERLAVVYGDEFAIGRITAVANGEGADPADAWAVQHAKDVLAQITNKTVVGNDRARVGGRF
jgi:predicted chitinase